MPLDAFIAEVVEALGADGDKALVERVKRMRNSPGPPLWKG